MNSHLLQFEPQTNPLFKEVNIDEAKKILHNYESLINLESQSEQDPYKENDLPQQHTFTQEQLDNIIKKYQQSTNTLQNNQQQKYKKRKSQAKGNSYKSITNQELLQEIKKMFREYSTNKESIKFERMAQILNMNIRTVYKFWKQWRQDPDLKIRQRQILKNKNSSKHGRGIEELSQRRCEAVLKLLDIHRKWKLIQIADILNTDPTLTKPMDGVFQPIRSYQLSRIMLAEGFRRIRIHKKIKTLRNPQAIKQRQQFCQIIIENLNKMIPIFYFFCVNLDIHFKRKHGWYRSNEIEKIHPPLQLDECGILVTALAGPKGQISWQIQHQELTKQSFILTFMKHFDTLHNDNNTMPEIIVLEKNDLTLSTPIQQYLKAIKMRVLYLPAKSYRLNPFDGWFYKIKSRIKRKQFDNLSQIMAELKKIRIQKISVLEQINVTKKYVRTSVYNWTAHNID